MRGRKGEVRGQEEGEEWEGGGRRGGGRRERGEELGKIEGGKKRKMKGRRETRGGGLRGLPTCPPLVQMYLHYFGVVLFIALANTCLCNNIYHNTKEIIGKRTDR